MKPKSFVFTYDGSKRYVVDATYEPEHNSIVGMEVTKAGKPSNQIKRFKLDKING